MLKASRSRIESEKAREKSTRLWSNFRPAFDRGAGQSQGPKKRGHTRADHRRRGANPLPARLLARTQPHRDDVEQSEDLPLFRRGLFTLRSPSVQRKSPRRGHPQRC